jgi:hypothetical protein
VPDLLRANACEFLQYRATVARPLGAAFKKRVQVTAHCAKLDRHVEVPQIGCGECHPLPPQFVVKE